MGKRVISVLCVVLLMAACGGNSTAPLVTAYQPDTISPALADALSTELERVLQLSGRDRNTSAPPLQNHNRVADFSVVDSGSGGVTVGFAYLNVGDYDLNGEVNVSDLTPIGMGFGMTSTSPDWFQRGVADGDGNGEVNISDVTPIGQNFGNAVTGYIIEMTTTPEDVESWVEVGTVLLSEVTRTTAQIPDDCTCAWVEYEHESTPAEGTAWSATPFVDTADGRESGIPTYGEEIIPLDCDWGQIGGNEGHTGQTETSLPGAAEFEFVIGGGHTLDLSCPPVTDTDGNWYFGCSDGTLWKTDAVLDVQWSTNLGSACGFITLMSEDLLVTTGTGYEDSEAGTECSASLCDKLTGEVLDKLPLDGVAAYPPCPNSTPGFENSFAIGDTLGNAYGCTVTADKKLNLEWKAEYGGGTFQTLGATPLGDMFTFLLMAEIAGEDTVVNISTEDGEVTVLESGLDVTGDPVRDYDGGDWFLIDGGTRLRRHGGKGGFGPITVALQDGDICTAFAADPDARILYIGYAAANGNFKIFKWDFGEGQSLGHVQVNGRVERITVATDYIVTITKDESGTTATSYDKDLNQQSEITVWEHFNEEMDLSSVDDDLMVCFDPSVAEAALLRPGEDIQKLGHDLGGSRPFTALTDGIVTEGAMKFEWKWKGTFEETAPGVERYFGDDVLAVNEPHGEIPILIKNGLFPRAGVSTSSSALIVLDNTGGWRHKEIRSASKRASAEADAGFTLYEMDGTMVWDFPLTDAQVSAAAFQTDRLCLASNPIGGAPGTLYCLAELDGGLLWETALPGVVLTTPTLDASGRCVVATDEGTVSCFDDTGAEAWTASHPVVTSGLMVDNGRLYFCSSASLFILDMVDGSTLHEVSLPSANEGSTPSKWTNGRVVVSTGIGELVWIDPTAASPVANLHAMLGANCISQPVCDTLGQIVVATVDGAVQCLDPDGSQLWKVETGKAQWLELSVASDGTIFAAGTNGGTYVIGPQ